jgi:hypothetical protein
MHFADQIFRISIGLAMIYFGFIDNSIITDPIFGIPLGLFGVLNLVSGLVAKCPVYAIAGISTYKAKQTTS